MIPSAQASNESEKRKCLSPEHKYQQQDSQDFSTTFERDSMILPHDRVGSDFSWLQVPSQEESTVQKTKELEDEESFLYGNDTTWAQSVVALSKAGEQGKLPKADSLAFSGQQQYRKSVFTSCSKVLDMKPLLQASSPSIASANVESSESENIKNIFKSLDTAELSDIMAKVRGPTEGKDLYPALLSSDPSALGVALPGVSDPNVRKALESLQSLIKGENPTFLQKTQLSHSFKSLNFRFDIHFS